MNVEDVTADLVRLVDSPTEARSIVSQLDAGQLHQVVEGLKRQVLNRWKEDAQKAAKITDLILCIADWRRDEPIVRALCLQTKAILLALVEREYEESLDFFERSNALYSEAGDELGIAVGEIVRVWALACLQRFDESFSAAEWAKGVLTSHQRYRSLAALENNLTAIYIRNGQDAEALERIIKVEAAYKELGEEGERRLPLALINRAFVLRNLGRFEESLEANSAALETAEKYSQTAIIARAKLNFGMTYFVLGEFNKAHVYLQEARDLFLKEDLQRDAIIVELFISDGYLHLRRFESVIEKCRQVRETFQEAGAQFEVAQAFLNEATALAGLKAYDKAHEVLEEARDIFKEEKNLAWQVRTDIEEALIYFHQQDYVKCRKTAESVIPTLEVLKLPVMEAQARVIAARAAIALGEIGPAQALTGEALQVAQEKGLPSLSYQCHYLRGEIALTHHDLKSALAAYEAAINELEKMQGKIMVEFRADFLTDKEAAYASAVNMCLELENPGSALNFAERAKSRALLYLLSHHIDLKIEAKTPKDEPLVNRLHHLREKRDRLYRRLETGETPGGSLNQQIEKEFSEVAHVQAQQVIVETENEIRQLWHRLLARNTAYSREAGLWQTYSSVDQTKLAPGEIIVEYFMTAEGLIVFLVSNENIRAHRLAVTAENLSRQQQFLWLNFNTLHRVPQQALTLTRNAQAILQKFYEQLIEPVASELASMHRLIIVPHGLLHYLPFHAFYDGSDYLLKKYQISYLPGATFIGLNQPKAVPNPKSFVLGFDPGGRLPNVAKEVEVVAQHLGSAPYLNGAATKLRFQEEAPQAQIIHLAAHGDFRQNNPLFSGLHLQDGLLTTLDIFNLTLPASLVTLSACQTGKGVIGGGDELLGLMRAFLAAGTASLLLTLWQVEDEITAEMMHDFYGFMKDGRSKIEALQQSQLKIINHYSGQLESHPFFWAPFFLVGDNGPV